MSDAVLQPGQLWLGAWRQTKRPSRVSDQIIVAPCPIDSRLARHKINQLTLECIRPDRITDRNLDLGVTIKNESACADTGREFVSILAQ
jgi:hypothetical protein